MLLHLNLHTFYWLRVFLMKLSMLLLTSHGGKEAILLYTSTLKGRTTIC